MAEHENLRLDRLRQVVSFFALLLVARVLMSILLTYRDYFPADFNSAFLAGRQDHFYGIYGIAFYLHLIVGPLTLVFAYALQFSGSLMRRLNLHRPLGKLQVALIVLILAPTGIVMSTQANTGPVAGWGFASLSLLVGWSAIQSVLEIRQGNFAEHRVWANRCFLLLNSPLILRLTSGTCYVLGIESDLTYQLSAWLSWLAPLLLFECYRHHIQDNVLMLPIFHFSSLNRR